MVHPAARAVDGPRDQLLPGAGLPGEQHGRVGGRHLPYETDHVIEDRARTDDLGEARLLAHRLLEVRVLEREVVPQALDLHIEPRAPDDGRRLDREDLQVLNLLRRQRPVRQQGKEAGQVVADHEREKGARLNAILPHGLRQLLRRRNVRLSAGYPPKPTPRARAGCCTRTAPGPAEPVPRRPHPPVARARRRTHSPPDSWNAPPCAVAVRRTRGRREFHGSARTRRP